MHTCETAFGAAWSLPQSRAAGSCPSGCWAAAASPPRALLCRRLAFCTCTAPLHASAMCLRLWLSVCLLLLRCCLTMLPQRCCTAGQSCWSVSISSGLPVPEPCHKASIVHQHTSEGLESGQMLQKPQDSRTCCSRGLTCSKCSFAKLSHSSHAFGRHVIIVCMKWAPHQANGCEKLVSRC